MEIHPLFGSKFGQLRVLNSTGNEIKSVKECLSCSKPYCPAPSLIAITFQIVREGCPKAHSDCKR
jgi:hypothetical protein